jgi:uncharacterized membrane protein YphA (DoxX/SURF4 family)
VSKLNVKLAVLSRYLLGLIFFLAGLAGLFNLAPPPKDLPEAMMTFMTGMMAAKYFFPLLKLTETLCGLMLLLGFAPALSLIILAPVSINILFVHVFLTPGFSNLILPILILLFHIVAATNFWSVYKPLFHRFTLRNN